MRANLPLAEYFVGQTVPGRPDIKIVEAVASGNDGRLYRARSDTLQRDLACKIIPRSNLQVAGDGQPIWQAEVHKADALRSNTVVKFEEIRDWRDEAAGIDCVALISEFVEGPNLRTFILQHANAITIPFVIGWLETMLELLNEMQQRNVNHGDLHAGNILVEDRSGYALRGSRFEFRVTDFGVSEATSDRRFKDDFEQLADVLGQLLKAVKYQSLGPRDKYLFGVLRDQFVGKHLIERDLTHDPLARQPARLFDHLQRADKEFVMPAEGNSPRLLSPFDFLSCEQIGDEPSLLRALYSERFLGLPEIESRNNVVVTGPRGCGKSTVFKSLSLDQKIRIGDADPTKISYLGIYYRCDDLYFAFPRYVVPERAEGLDIPVHFATASLLARLLTSLETWAKVYFGDEFVRNEATLARQIWDLLGLAVPNEPGAESFRALSAHLDRQRRKAVDWQRFVHDPNRTVPQCFGVGTLQQVCGALTGTLAFLRERPVYFLIDDYSMPKVTRGLQLSLNRVFMQRTSFCFFKLSTESPVSFTKSDLDEKIYVEAREFSLHNLGLVYLHSEAGPKLLFIEDIFRRRLAETSGAFPAKELAELVGSNHAHNNNEDARQIRDEKKLELWGKEALCNLCSGDIHYLIKLVGDMVKMAGGPEEIATEKDAVKLSRKVQNKAIREAAGGFLRSLRGVPQHGEKLVAIVEAFGNVAHSFIRHRVSKNEDAAPPHQATRIEPYEPFVLSSEAQTLYDELLRYSVFIEDIRGKSRRGKVVARLFLRRFLIPHFNLTFSTRDSLEVEPRAFEQFLLKPDEFEKARRLRERMVFDEDNTMLEGAPDQMNLKLPEGE
jgi:hypothetical protein